MARGFIFFRINYHPDSIENVDEDKWIRGYQYSVIVLEIINGAMIMYIAARNLQSSEEPEQEDEEADNKTKTGSS